MESCANLVTIFDASTPKEDLLKTSVRCVGSNELHIFTHQPMKIRSSTAFNTAENARNFRGVRESPTLFNAEDTAL